MYEHWWTVTNGNITSRDGHRVRGTVYTDGTYGYSDLPMSLAICNPTVWIRCSDWPSRTVYGCSRIVMVMPLCLGAGGEIAHWGV